jgi:predicted Rossmann fold flavoprotein
VNWWKKLSNTKKYSTAVIGGGAAGICAAISKARLGEPVIICEKMAQIGKKILASGDGRCNLLNDDLNESYYNPKAQDLVKSIFDKFDKFKILKFFKELGLETYSKEGRIFPVTNQAASVLKVLEMEIERLSIPIEFGFDCSGLSFSKNGILVLSKAGKNVECQRVIITGGGKAYPSSGSDGSIYDMVIKLGHTIIEPVPVMVPIVVKDNLCSSLQGQKIFATARSIVEGEASERAEGELLFTKYGLSGTCILDVSEAISVALNRDRKSKVLVSIDMVPFMNKDQLKNEFENRLSNNFPADAMLIGILPNKMSVALKGLFMKNDLDIAVNALKDWRFKVTGTRDWSQAEFTSGGISIEEIKTGTLESKLRHGVYFAGEIIDVNGKRGGYNLGWAWASGFVAGLTGSD